MAIDTRQLSLSTRLRKTTVWCSLLELFSLCNFCAPGKLGTVTKFKGHDTTQDMTSGLPVHRSESWCADHFSKIIDKGRDLSASGEEKLLSKQRLRTLTSMLEAFVLRCGWGARSE
jgi:hypothetical protein